MAIGLARVSSCLSLLMRSANVIDEMETDPEVRKTELADVGVAGGSAAGGEPVSEPSLTISMDVVRPEESTTG
ncbi:hypothetical protein ACH4TV_46445 [Streptomyces sp. NPDC020898]|uniref:hypothetical protein n=1 Tax=Streptomyces sp. NPDC020898 TaxID=3365101 RepID=UPI00379251C8